MTALASTRPLRAGEPRSIGLGFAGARPTRASTAELVRLAWPLIVSNSCWTLQIVLDRVLLSRSSSDEVAAGMQAALFFWTPVTLFQYTANYATTFVAQYLGAGRAERVGAVIGQAMWFAVVSGLAFLLLIPFAGPLFALVGHAPELQALEVAYFQCLCYAGLPILVTAAGCSFFAGRGDSRTVLLVNASGLAVNGLCAWVLIFGKFGFPALGITGAGWATVLGTSTSALLCLVLLLLPRYRREFGNGAGWRFDGKLLRRLLRFGLPQGVGVALEVLAFTVFMALIGLLGKAELAASTIASTLNLLAYMPMLGVGQAVEVMVGRRLGEDDPDRAAQATWTGMYLSVGFTALVALAYVLVPGLLVAPFANPTDANWPAVAAMIPALLGFVALYCLFDSLNIVFSFALRGAGDTLFVSSVSLSLSWPVMVVPTWYVWRYGLGLYWAWGFASLYVIVLGLVFVARFLQGRWRTMRVIEQPAAPEDEEGQATAEALARL